MIRIDPDNLYEYAMALRVDGLTEECVECFESNERKDICDTTTKLCPLDFTRAQYEFVSRSLREAEELLREHDKYRGKVKGAIPEVEVKSKKKSKGRGKKK